MDSAMIHKMIKARQYAEEPQRIHLLGMQLEMRGDDHRHRVGLEDGRWSCDCEYYRGHGVCAHTMAMEKVMEKVMAELVPEPVG